MTLTPESNITLISKFKNIALAFVVMLIWVVGMQAFLSLFMNTPAFIPHRSHITFVGFFFACIVAPLWEELAFRAVPLTVARMMNVEAILPVAFLSSIVFGFGHGYGPVSLLFQGVMGFVFAVVYVKNNYCYVSAVTLHAFWNFYCFIFF